ncbi:MAG: hypothetical protein CMP09_08375 [Yangia sp.]|nr:hypothetical protein [Salipiger sp.]
MRGVKIPPPTGLNIGMSVIQLVASLLVLLMLIERADDRRELRERLDVLCTLNELFCEDP